MIIDVIDGSNYFKGLLLLIRKDHKISNHEAELMKKIGKSLGLNEEFCDEAIRDILGNAYISDAPPKFSTETLAKKFIRDGLRLASADNELHDLEEEWLRAVAAANGIGTDWVAGQKHTALDGTIGEKFDAFDLRIRYHG